MRVLIVVFVLGLSAAVPVSATKLVAQFVDSRLRELRPLTAIVVSRKVPNALVWAQRRARKPSKKSVTAAIANRIAPATYALSLCGPARMSAMINGISATRSHVTAWRVAEARASAAEVDTGRRIVAAS